MKRSEFVKFIQNGKTTHAKECVLKDKSVTDPSFAQTGRQMLTNPLPIEYRMKYPDGTPLNKENPMDFNEFDKLYPDHFKAVREAQSVTKETQKTLKKVQEEHKKQQLQQPQN